MSQTSPTFSLSHDAPSLILSPRFYHIFAPVLILWNVSLALLPNLPIEDTIFSNQSFS